MAVKLEQRRPSKHAYEARHHGRIQSGRRSKYKDRAAAENARSGRWKAENHERVLEYARQWRMENPEAARAKDRAWRAANPDKNREMKRNADAARRARLKEVGGNHTVAQFRAKCEASGWRCTYCQAAITPTTASRDHAVPIAAGGHNGIENIVPACRPCNTKKNTKSVEAFMREVAAAKR